MANQQANLAFYYAAGPVHIYVRIPSQGLTFFTDIANLAGQVLFLGHAEEAPEPDFVPNYMPVHSALSGPVVPDDFLYMGSNYKTQVTFSRFSYDVVQLLLAAPNYGRGAAPGSETFLDRGRFLIQNGDGFELWMRNSFFGTPNAAAYPNMPIGYYFPCVRMAGTYPRKLSRENTRMVMHIEPANVRRGVVGGYIAYTQDPKYFVDLPLPG